MINQESIAAVKAAHFGKGFCRPLYDTYGFSRIPATIEALFTGDHAGALPAKATNGLKVDYVFLFLVDAFGWRFFEKYASYYPFLNRFIEKGVVSKITSQFPSTTAAHVTCMNTGKSVAATGIYEWFYYEPKVDRVIAPLLYSFAGDKEAGTLKNAISPEEIYPTQTFYQRLKKKGIDSYVFKHQSIVDSPYSSVTCNGATTVPYQGFDDGLGELFSLVKMPRDNPAYFYLYFGDIDAMGHRYGFDSQHFDQAIEHCFQALETLFYQRIEKLGKKAACIVIADHGMTQIDPQKTFYLNEKMPGILDAFKKNRNGNLIAPAGSCRDFFLHIQEDRIEEVKMELEKQLRDSAWIVPTQILIDEGFFGSENASKEFLSRVGNLVILPYEGKSVWWLEKGKFDQHFLGAHGGLTHQEMETIFLFQQF